MKVLFNASVILAGLRSPDGGSGAMLKLVESGKIQGIISEFIFKEVLKHSEKLGIGSKVAGDKTVEVFSNNIFLPPLEAVVNKYKSLIIDPDDAHILATYDQEGCDVIVTLDKKHLLILQGKIKGVNIVSPGEFLTKFYSEDKKRMRE